MQTLKIEIPNGFAIDSFDAKSGEIKFKPKPKNVMERIKTVSDVIAEHGFTQREFDIACEGMAPFEKAFRSLVLIAQTLNEGWKPNWKNSSEYKYYPWFEMNGSSGFRFDGFGRWHSDSYVGSRLCFKSRELAEYAGQQFTEVYRIFMIID